MAIKEVLHTDLAPAAVGPYSQAIAANGFVFTSGQVPIDPKAGKIVATTIEEQTEQVMKNLQCVLAQGGVSFDRGCQDHLLPVRTSTTLLCIHRACTRSTSRKALRLVSCVESSCSCRSALQVEVEGCSCYRAKRRACPFHRTVAGSHLLQQIPPENFPVFGGGFTRLL